MDFIIAIFEILVNIVALFLQIALYPFGYRPKIAEGEGFNSATGHDSG